MCRQIQYLVRTCFWIIDSCSLDVSSYKVKSGKGALQVSYIRGPILFLEDSTLKTLSSQKPQLQNFNMWIRGKGDTDFQPMAEQMWIEKRRELRMESRKLHILSSVLERSQNQGLAEGFWRGRRVMRGVIEIRKEGQGKVIEHVEAFPTQTGRSVMDTFFFFLSGRPQGYFHCSHPAKSPLPFSQQTYFFSDSWLPYAPPELWFAWPYGYISLSPPSRTNLHGLFVSSTACQQPQSQLHCCSSELVGERIWLVCLRSGVDFCSTLLWPSWGSVLCTRFLVFSS